MNREEMIRESEQVGNLLKQINKKLGAISNQLMTEHNVTESLSAVLGFLEDRKETETCQVDIQNALHLSNPAVTKLVGRLEKKGLIAINRREDDQRYKVIVLTERGKQIMTECKSMKEPLQLGMLVGFQTDEIQKLKEYLHRIQENTMRISLRHADTNDQ